MSSIVPIRTEGTCSRCLTMETVIGFQVMGTEVGLTPSLCLQCLGDPTKTIPIEPVELEVEEKPRKVISKARRDRVTRQEVDLAKKIGGRTQAASGAMLGSKGDVRKKGVLRIECKSTTARSYILKRDILDKISSECGRGEQPALDILFLDHATLREQDRWVAIPFQQFMEYADALSDDRRPSKG